MAFMSTSINNTSSTNEAVNTAHEVSTASTKVNVANSTNIDNLSDDVICDMEEMNLRWQMAMLTMRARRAPRNQDNKKESSRKSVLVKTSTSTALVSCDGLGGYDWSDQEEEGPNYALMVISLSLTYSTSSYTGNFMPSTYDLSFIVRKSDDSPIIEDWVSDNVSQTKIEKKTVKPSIAKIKFVKPKQQDKTARKTVKQVEKHRRNTHNPRGNQRNWNNMMSQRLGSNFEMFNKACYVCGSFDHLQVDCNYHQKQFQNQRMVKPVWNNAQRVNHKNFAKKAHPCAKKNIVPRAVLMKSGLDQGVIDSGCSRHMTGNMSYLTDYEEIDGGYVAFGGNPKRGKSQEKQRKVLN
ncbi:hypothetical protein Tco_1482242 [Tanacetum coccineum]